MSIYYYAIVVLSTISCYFLKNIFMQLKRPWGEQVPQGRIEGKKYR